MTLMYRLVLNEDKIRLMILSCNIFEIKSENFHGSYFIKFLYKLHSQNVVSVGNKSVRSNRRNKNGKWWCTYLHSALIKESKTIIMQV